MKNDIKLLTIKKIIIRRGGRAQLIFKGGEAPYNISAKDAEHFSVGMQVYLKKGKIFSV